MLKDYNNLLMNSYGVMLNRYHGTLNQPVFSECYNRVVINN